MQSAPSSPSSTTRATTGEDQLDADAPTVRLVDVSWSEIPIPVETGQIGGGYFTDIVYSPIGFVAGGVLDGHAQTWRSDDGVEWELWKSLPSFDMVRALHPTPSGVRVSVCNRYHIRVQRIAGRASSHERAAGTSPQSWRFWR